MISISDNYRKKQVKDLDKLIMKAFRLGHKHYDHLLKWKQEHLKAIKH
ncbi:hypothetical protein C8C76_11531 [Halanaerobium saccharolyticum]|jgi:predicted nucleic acid-binding protein|uniref:Uncharacterized protein n=1 Tax=Halanaerobium saccharolyticum TaxID=43595 RepID=A0A2T5RJA9_9FIRM|nr:hypothetical protein C8C76_11531 [Halanaerobium saccharolyticum]